jgi:hypothetical protein
MGWKTRIAAPVALALLGLSCTVGSASADDGSDRSLAALTRIYFERSFKGDTDDTVGRVKLMPIPAGNLVSGTGVSTDPAILVGSLDVTLAPGTPFVLPIAAWYGESYNNGWKVDAPLKRSVFTGSRVRVKIDGQSIIDSRVDNLNDWYIAPQRFRPPVVYPQPTSYGSIQANFVQGLSFLQPALSRGDHTLTLESEIITFVAGYHGIGGDLDVGVKYRNSWTIHVTK